MHIEVKEHDPGIAKEYLAQEYPGVGLYMNRRMNYLYYVYTMPGSVTNSVIALPGIAAVKEDAPPEPVPQGLSETFVLKALAICQNPNLAAALTGKV